MTSLAKFFDGNVHNKINKKIDFSDQKYKGKIIGLYFSAHWCPPCRAFTPKLVEFYKTHRKDKNFEIIYISSDQDERTFDDYYKEMPWLKMDFKERKKREKLLKVFKVTGIPALILFDGDTGNIICTNAIEQIQYRDKKGETFPWKSC
ncbi:unnamed protein product [Adineta steineri]|uniref:Thioredoxin domain-containing protein n=1 Tax=Adineta steineri TaxID=433720 RepID=A0A818UT61_9BILA|nr:unnamed protein product [Adineta steineri]CAF3701366.1 unnamed protein product [Adineta steineri]